jgi:hypothetical protein
MHGENAEFKGHLDKTYRSIYSCGCPGTELHSNYIKKLTHKKERHTTRQKLHNLKRDIDSLGNHITYQLINEEDKWIPNLDYY